jgi:hypothetical protein
MPLFAIIGYDGPHGLERRPSVRRATSSISARSTARGASSSPDRSSPTTARRRAAA